MSRIVRIATTSLATLEEYGSSFNHREPDPADTLRRGLELLEAAGRQGADLACLPEGFMAAGLPASRLRGLAEPLSGPAFTAVAACARRHAMNVVAGFYVREEDQVVNRAVLIDRAGQLAGSYAKLHPTEGEIEAGVVPGAAPQVVATDIGRIGLAVCFDLNWPALWSALAEQGAELVCWLSAYEGGFPLQACAWQYQFPIVTSVWPYHARIIEPTGRIVAQTSRWGRLAVHDLNLDKRLFHTDGQAHTLLPMQARYGRRIRLETFTEEHLFTLESLDPELPVADVIAAFGLIDYRAYLARCTRAQIAARGGPPVVQRPLAAAIGR
jgi:predicted amidohydrolase